MKERELNEQIKRIRVMIGLNEALTDVIYHFTRMGAFLNILKTNKFITTAAVGTISDREINQGRFFFFSTTRSKSAGYRVGNVKLVLDGRKLNQRYKGTPVDYFRYSKNKSDYHTQSDYMNAISSTEQEDRIITNEPYINNALSYITEIHIYISKYDSIKKTTLDYIKRVCEENGVSLYFYDNRENWLSQNKSTYVVPEEKYNLLGDEGKDYTDSKDKTTFKEYVYLAVLLAYNDQGNYNKVLDIIGGYHDFFKIIYEDQVRQYLDKSVYNDVSVMLYEEHIDKLRDSHNPIARELLKSLSNDMKKKNVNNVKDYIELKHGN
jgi:hypothetical protein